MITKNNAFIVVFFIFFSIFALNACKTGHKELDIVKKTSLANDCNKTLNKIDDVAKDRYSYGTRVKSEILYMEGYCLQSLGKKEKAKTVYEYILNLPKTKFTIRANARLEELMKQSAPVAVEEPLPSPEPAAVIIEEPAPMPVAEPVAESETKDY